MKVFYTTLTLVAFLLFCTNGIHAQTETQEVKLMNALQRGDQANALLIVSNIENANYKDDKGFSLLIYASDRGFIDISKILIKKGQI
jgi:ankyrin repeat protein